MHHRLARPAAAVVNSIKVVKPDKAAMVENLLMNMQMRGQLHGKVRQRRCKHSQGANRGHIHRCAHGRQVTEEQLKGLLAQVTQKTAKATSVTVSSASCCLRQRSRPPAHPPACHVNAMCGFLVCQFRRREEASDEEEEEEDEDSDD
jgi:DNA-binding TFAR19-related protein (PDSD5 family)